MNGSTAHPGRQMSPRKAKLEAERCEYLDSTSKNALRRELVDSLLTYASLSDDRVVVTACLVAVGAMITEE